MQIVVPQSRAALVAAGYTKVDVDSALRRGAVRALHRGVVMPATSSDNLWMRCYSALATQCDEAAIFGRTAAAMLGLAWVPQSWSAVDTPVHVAVPREDLTRSRRAAIERHIRAMARRDIVEIDGLPVTSAARTLCDLACTEPRHIVLSILDGGLTTGVVRAAELSQSLEGLRGLRHVRRAREVIALGRAGVDSPAETRVRLQIVDAGLPTPDVRLELRDAAVLLARGDLGYWRWLIWLEYDGYATHADRSTFRSDRHRDRWLARRGWEVMRLSDRDVSAPASYLGQLATALREAPARIDAMPASRSPEVAAARQSLGLL